MSDSAEPVETIESVKAKLESVTRAQAGSDAAYSRAATKIAALEAELAKLKAVGGTEEAIKARLDTIERKAAERVRKAELGFYARSKAVEAGVDYELFRDMPFEDEAQVDKHLAKLATFIEAKKQVELERLLSSSPKPKTGVTERPYPVDAVSARIKREVDAINL
jgi:hypothetical protein